MTNEEILKKAIKKAIRNVYKYTNDYLPCDSGDTLYYCQDDSEMLVDCDNLYFVVIFSHNFVKAFWNDYYISGIDYHGSGHGKKTKLIDWKYHLQQMVLEEEPLKYLEKFL